MKQLQITGLLLCGMLAGIAQGATIRYRLSGDYFNFLAAGNAGTNGWENVLGVPGLPGGLDLIRFNWANNTVTLAAVAPTVSAFQMGVNESGGLVVNNGGSLTTTANSTIGNSNNTGNPVNGFLTVTTGGYVKVGGVLTMGSGSPTGTGSLSGDIDLNGGTLEIQSHLWVAARLNTTGTIDINNGGILKVGSNFGLGTIDTIATGGTATVNVNAGGLLSLNNWSSTKSIFPGSILNINQGGTVTIKGNRVTAANDYFSAGLIGTDLTGIEATFDSGLDLTTIIAIPEPGSFMLVGLAGLGLLTRRRRLVD